MAKTHRPYASKFRRQIVELVRAGRDPAGLAREFEPSAQAIRNWVAQADRQEGRREAKPTADTGLSAAERQSAKSLDLCATTISCPSMQRALPLTQDAQRNDPSLNCSASGECRISGYGHSPCSSGMGISDPRCRRHCRPSHFHRGRCEAI